MEVLGQEEGRIGNPKDVATVASIPGQLKPSMSAAGPAASVYSGAGAPGVPAYKGYAASNSEMKPEATPTHSGNVNVFPINMLNPYQNKCVFWILSF